MHSGGASGGRLGGLGAAGLSGGGLVGSGAAYVGGVARYDTGKAQMTAQMKAQSEEAQRELLEAQREVRACGPVKHHLSGLCLCPGMGAPGQMCQVQ